MTLGCNPVGKLRAIISCKKVCEQAVITPNPGLPHAGKHGKNYKLQSLDIAIGAAYHEASLFRAQVFAVSKKEIKLKKCKHKF